MLVAIFAAMILLFAVTQLFALSFRRERENRARTHFQMAQTLADYRYLEEAIEQYRDALIFSPDNPEARLGLGVSLYYLGRFSEAENHFLELRASDPTHAVVNRLLARIAARRGDIDAAVDYYRTAIYGRWPQNSLENRIKVRFELVELLKAHGQKMQVVGELLELLDEAPEDDETRKRIGRLFLETGAAAYALDVFQEVLAANPQDAGARAGAGQAEFSLGNYISARAAFSAALRYGLEDEEVARLLDLCEEIISLDPTSRGIGRYTSLERSRELVERTLATVEHCINPRAGPDFVGPPAPPPEPLAPLIRQARELTGDKRQRADEKTIEGNTALAERLWSAGRELCPEIEQTDSAVAHVLKKLSR